MLSLHPTAPGPIHMTTPTNLHSPVQVVDDDAHLNIKGLFPSPGFFGSSARRDAFPSSRWGVSSLSCSRSPFQDLTNDDSKSSHGQPARSWSKGSSYRSRSSLPPAAVQTKANPPKSATTRPRGRSDSQRKVHLSFLPLTRATRYPSQSGYPPGQITSNLRRVGVEECHRWVTGTPPSTWPVIRATQSSRVYTTITKHLPEMLEQAIKGVEGTLQSLVTEQSLLFLHNQHRLSVCAMDSSKDIVQLEEKSEDLEQCINRMEVLLSEVHSKSALQPIQDDGERDVRLWNRKLQQINRADGSCTFMTGPALFVEAYVYRRLRGCFTQSTFWKDHDVFFDRKCGDFVQSADRVLELSRQFSEPFNAGDCVFPWERLEKIREAFFELLSVCVPETSDDQESFLNMMESKPQAANDNSPTEIPQSLPASDGNRMWEFLSKNYHNVESRVDLVLNNAGLELFYDLALGDFMIQTGLASEVHFHGKQFPWSVSDATQRDWDWLIGSLSDKHLNPNPTSAERTSLQELGERWKGYEKEGKFVYEQHPFWCTAVSFWELPTHAPDLFSRLSTSSLVLFKGNLNYRRLTAGRRVPRDTPFNAAIGQMATHPRAPPVCSLRMMNEQC